MAFLALDEIRSGYRLDHYTLLEPIGYGGQGTIWSALDDRLGRVVAIKVAPIAPGDDVMNATEIMREAETVRRLDHPNVLPIYGFGQTEKVRYLSMMYAPGGSLHDRLRRGPLDVHHILFIATQIGAALSFVHARRVIHRDLKPSNILTDTRGRIYLSDFGLARIVSDETQLLHTGHGTPLYAPPEQIAGRAMTGQSDIYSFGVVLYELLCGGLPWGGTKSLATAQTEDGEALPYPQNPPREISAGLFDALRHLTALDQDERPASADAALDEVTRALLADGFPANVLERIKTQALALPDPDAHTADTVEDLLGHSLDARRQDPGRVALSLTHFTLVDAIQGRADGAAPRLSPEQCELMWQAALKHGRSIDRWWAELGSPQARLEACERLIPHADAAMLEHVILLLASLPDSALRADQLSRDSLRRLLEAGMAAPDLTLRSRSVELIRRVPVETGRWQPFVFDEALDSRLGEMALDEGFGAEEAAHTIGRLRSEAAVGVALADYAERRSPRALSALRAIALAAGDLPGSAPPGLRLRFVADQAWRQLALDPPNLLRVLAASVAAGFTGLLLHFYLVVRAPQFLDADRLLIALERALISGPILGVTLFAVRWLASRLSIPTRAAGLAASLAAGVVGCTFTIVIIDYLFLKTVSIGWAVAAGGLALSLGFAAAARLPKLSWPLKGLIGAAGVWLGIAGSWLLYLATGASPLFYYDEAWPLSQALFSAAAVSLAIGLVAHLVDLTQQLSYTER